jgi:hypothetical protein
MSAPAGAARTAPGWLETEDDKPERSIAEGDPVRPLTPTGLEAVPGELPMPPSPRLLLAARDDLRRRIRSDCVLSRPA